VLEIPPVAGVDVLDDLGPRVLIPCSNLNFGETLIERDDDVNGAIPGFVGFLPSVLRRSCRTVGVKVHDDTDKELLKLERRNDNTDAGDVLHSAESGWTPG
jgi:hypothetical protein